MAVLWPTPPESIALTVARYVPDARPLKNVARLTLMSPFASGVGLPRSDDAIGVAVLVLAPAGVGG